MTPLVPPVVAPLVSIENLTLEARTRAGIAHILRGVDLVIGQGRIVGVVGESGSGKSTLALALLRLLPANVIALGGHIRMHGQDIAALDEPTMRTWRGSTLAMIFQDPATALNPVFTIGTHLTDVLRRRDPGLSRAERHRRAEQALARVEIPDPARRLRAYPHELSGGQRQRVMIAMALLARPDLLLADEPTTALDATIEAGIIALFQALRTELGGSVLFISHHLGLVATICDDIAVMYAGRILETGPASAVCATPRHPYTQALLACEPDRSPPDTPLRSIPGKVPDPHAVLPGCVFAPRCAQAEPRCHQESQPLRPLGPERSAACWKAS